jgi:hypothetical protein
MTEREEHLPDGFLVDGVAPPVIGADLSPDAVGEVYDFEPGARREPPTTPIRAQRPPGMPGGQPPPQGGQQSADQPKGWFGRMFGRP